MLLEGARGNVARSREQTPPSRRPEGLSRNTADVPSAALIWVLPPVAPVYPALPAAEDRKTKQSSYTWFSPTRLGPEIPGNVACHLRITPKITFHVVGPIFWKVACR